MKTFRRDGIYLPRIWWWFPWHLTRWWMPKIWKGSDEWCNIPLCFTVPPFGCFLVFQFWRPMRTEPCPECSALEISDGRMTAWAARRSDLSAAKNCCPTPHSLMGHRPPSSAPASLTG